MKTYLVIVSHKKAVWSFMIPSGRKYSKAGNYAGEEKFETLPTDPNFKYRI